MLYFAFGMTCNAQWALPLASLLFALEIFGYWYLVISCTMIGLKNHKGHGSWAVRTFYIWWVLDLTILFQEVFWLIVYLALSYPGTYESSPMFVGVLCFFGMF